MCIVYNKHLLHSHFENVRSIMFELTILPSYLSLPVNWTFRTLHTSNSSHSLNHLNIEIWSAIKMHQISHILVYFWPDFAYLAIEMFLRHPFDRKLIQWKRFVWVCYNFLFVVTIIAIFFFTFAFNISVALLSWICYCCSCMRHLMSDVVIILK